MNVSDPKIVAETLPSDGNGAATPMMRQYLEIKAANPDCLLFYRMGDFYELFFQDAEIASRALNIVLTRRGKHQGADIPMCGVPVVRAEEYLHKLIAAVISRVTSRCTTLFAPRFFASAGSSVCSQTATR